MSWQFEAVIMLRTILNDAGCGTTDFSEDRLKELLIAAGYLNLTEIGFTTSYTISVSAQTISPDPSSDVTFMNFMILKAACLADQGTFRTKALAAGIEARCGPAVLKTLQHLDGFKTLLREGPCKTFEELLDQYRFSGNTDVIQAIMTPFVSNDWTPDLGGRYHSHRDRIEV